MRKVLHITVLTIFILSSIIAAVACGSNGGETPAPAPAPAPSPEPAPSPPAGTPEPDSDEPTNPYEIIISENGLNPVTLTVPVGTKVTWYNKDDRENARHWFKALDGSFDTRAIPKTARMSVTFDKPGVYEYQCLFHKDREDEKGTIIVE